MAIEDVLGRKIDTGNQTLTDIKALISSLMQGSVGPSKPFQTVPDKKDEMFSKLNQEMAKINSNFALQLAKAREYVTEMQKVLKEVESSKNIMKAGFQNMESINKNISKGIKSQSNLMIAENSKVKSTITNQGRLLSSRLNNLSGLMRSISSSSARMAGSLDTMIEMWKPFIDEGITKGSLYVHDIYAQEYLRKIAEQKGIDVSEIPHEFKRIQDAVMQKLGTTMSTAALAKEMSAWNKTMGADNKRLLKNLTGGSNKRGIELSKRAIKSLDGITNEEGFKELLSAGNYDDADLAKITDAIKSVAAADGGSKELKNALKAAGYKSSQILDIADRARVSVSAQDDPYSGYGSKYDKAEREMLKNLDNVVGYADKVFSLGKGESLQSLLFPNMGEIIKYTEDFRVTLAQVQGISFNNLNAQKEFLSVYGQIAETGVDIKNAQESALKNAKNGIRLDKEGNKLVKSQLAAERQIGVEAGSLNDYFRNFSMQFDQTGSQVAEIGLGLKSVAMNSKLSGEAMKNVVSKSETLAKKLRDAGTFTANANKNLLSVLAEGEKKGIGDDVGKIFEATIGIEAFTNAAPGLRAALANAGLAMEAMGGTLVNSEQNIRKAGESIRNQARGISETLADPKAFKQLVRRANQGDQLAQAELGKINMLSQKYFGMTGANLIKSYEAIEKGTKPFEQKVADLDSEYKRGLIEKQEYETKINRLQSDASRNLLEQYSQAASAGEQFTGKGFENEIKGLFGKESTTGQEVIQKAMEKVNEGLKKAGKDQIRFSKKLLDSASRGDDVEAIQKVQEAIQEGQRILDKEAIDKSSPLLAAANAMKELNELLSAQLGLGKVGLEWALGSVGKYGYLILGGLAGLSSIVLSGLSFLQTSLGKRLSKLYKNEGKRKVLETIFGSKFTNVLDEVSQKVRIIPERFKQGLTFIEGKLMRFFDKLINFTKSWGTVGTAFTNLLSGIRSGLREILRLSFTNWADDAAGNIGKLSKLKNFFRGIGAGFNNFVQGFGTNYQSIASFITKYATLNPLKMLKTLFEDAKKGFSLLFTGMKNVILTGVKGFLQTVFIFLDGIFGAISGYQNTAKNFELGRDESATFAQTISSTIAGALAGVLDGFTLGILRMTGAIDYVEAFLAKTIHAFLIFFTGVGDGFYAALEVMKPASDYLYGAFAELGKVFSDLYKDISYAFGIESDSKGFLNMVKGIGYVVGVVLGGAFQGLAFTLGIVVKGIARFVQVFGNGVGNVIAGIGNVVDGIEDLFYGSLSSLYEEGFAGMLYKIASGLGKIGYGLFQTVLGGFVTMLAPYIGVANSIVGYVRDIFSTAEEYVGSIVKDIYDRFYWLWNVLVGHSIVPDMVEAIVGLFKVMAGAAKLLVSPFTMFTKLLFKLITGPFKLLNLLSGGSLFKGSGTMLSGIGKVLGSSLSLAFKLFSTFNSWALGFANYLTGGWASKIVMGLGDKLKPIFSIIGNIIKPLQPIFDFLGTKLKPVLDTLKTFLGFKAVAPKAITDGIAKAAGQQGVCCNGIASALDNVAGTGAGGTAGKPDAKGTVAKGAKPTLRQRAGNLFTGVTGKVKGLLGFGAALAAPSLIEAATSSSAIASPAAAVAPATTTAAATAAAKPGLMAKAGGVLGSVGSKASSLLGGATKMATGFLSKIPLLGTALDFGIRMATGDDVGKAGAGAVGAGIGGVGGGIAGGALAAGLTAITGGLAAPLAPIITGLGSVAGTILGDFAGTLLYDILPSWESTSKFVSDTWTAGVETASGLWKGAVGIAGSIWDSATSIAGSAWQSVTETAGSAWNAVTTGAESVYKGFNETAEQAVLRREKEGSSFTAGAGNVYGGGAELLKGNLSEGVSKIASGVYEQGAAAANAAASAVSAGFKSFTGFFGFSEGTRKISESGLAYLHEGEVIVPSSIVDGLVAQGTGAFGTVSNFLKEYSPTLGVLSNAIGVGAKSIVGMATPSSNGTVQSELSKNELERGSKLTSKASNYGNELLGDIAKKTDEANGLNEDIRNILRDIRTNFNRESSGFSPTNAFDTFEYEAPVYRNVQGKSPYGKINEEPFRNTAG